jgi:hypothetical protein
MNWTQYDKGQVTNLVIALKKAKFEMTGMEVVAFADVFKWVSALHDHIEQTLTPKPFIPNPANITPAPIPPTAELPKEEKKSKKRKDEP